MKHVHCWDHYIYLQISIKDAISKQYCSWLANTSRYSVQHFTREQLIIVIVLSGRKNNQNYENKCKNVFLLTLVQYKVRFTGLDISVNISLKVISLLHLWLLWNPALKIYFLQCLRIKKNSSFDHCRTRHLGCFSMRHQRVKCDETMSAWHSWTSANSWTFGITCTSVHLANFIWWATALKPSGRKHVSGEVHHLFGFNEQDFVFLLGKWKKGQKNYKMWNSFENNLG